jgi:hypothetical protein
MALISSDLRDQSRPVLERTGGRAPKAPRGAAEQEGGWAYGLDTPRGSHMPLDTEPHWSWRNPLNILPAIILLLALLAIVGVIIT